MSVPTFVPLTNKAKSSVLYLIAILKKLVTAGEIVVVDVTIDASAGKISLYKNAELLVSHTDSNYDGMANTDANYHLGADSNYNKDLYGNVYFFRAYNKCLSASEVQQNYLATKGRYQ